MSKRRIIIIGASGVGKTTLVAALAPLLHLPEIPELGRKLCLDMGYERIGDIPQSEQENFKHLVLQAQISREEELDNFISDRSALDCWVLWQRWHMCSAMTYVTEDYYNKCRAQSALYTHIIYVPPMFAPAEDGFRWTDLDYQKQIDRLIRLSLYDWQLVSRTLFVQTGSPETRSQEVLAFLEK